MIGGVLDGLWRVLDRDEPLARLYFDLAAVAVVEPGVRAVTAEMRALWRPTLAELLDAREKITVFVMAARDGLALERLERGETRALRRARELFLRSATAAVSP